MMSDVSDNDQGSDMIDEEDDSDAVSHWEVPADLVRLSRQACVRRDSNPFRFSFCIFLHCSGRKVVLRRAVSCDDVCIEQAMCVTLAGI